MWRTFWTAAGVVGALVAFLVWASTQTVFLFKHPKTEGHRVIIDHRTGAAIVTTPVSATGIPVAENAKPEAVAPQRDHDFGIMDPMTEGTHDFVIRNEGVAPLRLKVGPTTCKCTVAGVADREIMPGASTTVTLAWNTGHQIYYSHSATIFTNDPHNDKFEFRLHGKVRMLIG